MNLETKNKCENDTKRSKKSESLCQEQTKVISCLESLFSDMNINIDEENILIKYDNTKQIIKGEIPLKIFVDIPVTFNVGF